MNIRKILDFIYPSGLSCIMCSKEIFEDNSYFCEDCYKNLPHLEGNLCKRCSDPIVSGDYCEHCKGKDFFCSRILSPFVYDGFIKMSVHELKFSGNKFFAEVLGTYMAREFLKHDTKCDIIMPVPLCEERLKKRKYNQAKLIADKFCEITTLPIDINTLVRCKNTPPQARLTFKERRENIKGAFNVIDKSKVKGKTILLIDDVYTTGSTLNECAKTLIKSGAKNVIAMTAGHTVLEKQDNEIVEN